MPEQPDLNNVYKKIDEEWKKKADNEKQDDETSKLNHLPEANFLFFISTLAMETLMALGEVENPISKTRETNVEKAKYMIDLIDMLNEKTLNNLSADEKTYLDEVRYDLKMRYMKKQI